MMEEEISAPRPVRWRWFGWVLVAAAVLTPMGACKRAVAPDAVPHDVGPDWAVVEEYLDQYRTWRKSSRERFRKGVGKGESPREMRESLPKPPDVKPAIAAATAILNLGGAHDKTIEAAEFLVMRAHSGRDSDQHMYVGAKALLAYGTRLPGVASGAEPDVWRQNV